MNVTDELISIVLPTYRRPEFLARAVASVRAQTYPNWELIIVDDNDPGSEARVATEEAVSQLAGDGRIRYIKHDSNRGGGAARNTGIRGAKGTSVAFLDDDDEWHPEKLEKQQRVLDDSDDEVGLVYAGMLKVYTESGKSQAVLPPRTEVDLATLLMRNRVGTTSAVLCRTEALQAVGGFDESLPSKQDIDLYVRLAKRYRLVAVPEVLVTWYRHAQASIGRNGDGVIRAHRLFLDKHRDEIVVRPAVHHYRLMAFGELLLRNGRPAEARSYFLQAMRIRPWDLRPIPMAFLPSRAGLALSKVLKGFTRRPEPSSSSRLLRE